ncbi:hypothetical protein [Saccharopolyspora pogona]|uniref:hypothetical protein n=1 Tax=Saccharopolyspora pogona TaxID=333966 RepID=UPI001688AE49|nr:hypothetical protein [Saccharopolyspora pogona]
MLKLSRVALIASALTFLAFESRHVLPRGVVLFELPGWTTPLAAATGVLGAALLMSSLRARRMLVAINGAAVLLLFLAAGGILFDLLRVFGLMGFPPDWPMFITRSFALMSAILLVRASVLRAREITGACELCGGPAAPPPRWLGYLGGLFALPYPVIKTNWALGGTIGLDYPDPARDGFTSGWLVVPAALIGIVLSLALVHRWGRIWPRWVPGLAGRPTPRGLLLFGGWFGTALLFTMGPAGAATVVSDLVSGTPSSTIAGMHYWPGALFYVSWMCWALVFGPSVYLYQRATRRKPCGTCDRVPVPQG